MLTRIPLIRTACLSLAAVIITATSLVQPASASTFKATSGALFNNPTGTSAQQNVIMDQLEKQIENTPSGSTIRMAFFSLNIPGFESRLEDAYNRGVNVVVIMDGHAVGTSQEALYTKLQGVLGKDTGKRSFAITCNTSCMDPGTGTFMHAKFYEFLATGSSKDVVTVSSANPSTAQETEGWNNAYTVVSDPTTYEAYHQYFNDMVAGYHGKKQPNYYTSVISGNIKTYLMPKGGSGDANDIIYGMLSNVSCSGVGSGYGTDGHTVIRVAMFEWTDSRLDLAKKLWDLDNAGCSVQVIYTPSVTDPAVLAALTKTGGKNGGITVFDGSKTIAGQNYLVHSKYMIINGKYAGDSRTKLVITGSQNWSGNGMHADNENTVKITSDAAYNAFEQNFRDMRDYTLR